MESHMSVPESTEGARGPSSQRVTLSRCLPQLPGTPPPQHQVVLRTRDRPQPQRSQHRSRCAAPKTRQTPLVRCVALCCCRCECGGKQLIACRPVQTATSNLARLTAALERNEQLTRELENIVQVRSRLHPLPSQSPGAASSPRTDSHMRAHRAPRPIS